MTTETKKAVDEVLRLPEKDFDEAVSLLNQVVDSREQLPLDPELLEEVMRRVDAVDRGEIELIDGDAVHEALERGECP